MIQLMLVRSLGKPGNGSLISMHFSKTSEKSVLPTALICCPGLELLEYLQ